MKRIVVARLSRLVLWFFGWMCLIGALALFTCPRFVLCTRYRCRWRFWS